MGTAKHQPHAHFESSALCRLGSRGGIGIWEEELKTCKVIKNNQNYFSLILKPKTFGEKPLEV